jgi:RNA polymerase sigma factor (sigma-70 family)
MHSEMASSAQLDESAVAAVRRGDAERYRELVERHERRVYAVAWSRLGDAALAEEVTQETFIRAYRRLWLLGNGAKFAAWVNTIARHVAINLGLRHRRELNKRERWALENPENSTAEKPPDETDPLCTPETLRRTLAELPDAHRECLVLFYLEGRSGAEAAAALGISEAALRVRLHRARSALRERLEERLADSLEQLKPGKLLVPAIMAGVLAAPSAKAATGGGGAAILATLVKFSLFKWLLPLFAVGIGILPGMALSERAAKAEQRNFRDPEGFRAQAHRAMYQRNRWLAPLMVIPLVVGIIALMSWLGERRTYPILAVFMVGNFAYFWITQRNRFQSGTLIWQVILTVGMVLIAARLVPPIANAFFLIAASLWMMWVIRKRPVRMDNSLFFRANLGMLEVPPDAAADIPAARLEKSDLMRFARFLGDRWLVNDFRWRPEGLLLRKTFLKYPRPANPVVCFLCFHRDSSSFLLAWNGEVTAHLSEADERQQRVLSAEEAALRARQEAQVAAAVKFAWREFRNGNTAAADRALGEKPDAEIFVVPPARAASTRWMQASLALVVILFAVMIVLARLPEIVKAFKVWFSR